jgi:hypothetical protein
MQDPFADIRIEAHGFRWLSFNRGHPSSHRSADVVRSSPWRAQSNVYPYNIRIRLEIAMTC